MVHSCSSLLRNLRVFLLSISLYESGVKEHAISIKNNGIIHGSDVEKRLSKEKHTAQFVGIYFD